MAPKKSIADQLRARLSPSRGHPEEGVDDNQEEFNPERTCFGVDPPRRGGPVAHWSPSNPFNQGVSCRGLQRDQVAFLHEEIVRLTLSGVLRPVEYSRWVSRAFLVPILAGSGWRLIVDHKDLRLKS